MNKTLYTKEEVKEALGINDLRNMSVDKVVELVSLIPHMDKELAMSIVGEFSNYAEMSKAMVKEMGEICDTAIKESKDSQLEAIAAYRQIINALDTALKDEKLTAEERMQITDKMIEVADKISAKDTEQKTFFKEVLKYKEYIIGGVIILGASILGVSVKGGIKGRLPKITK